MRATDIPDELRRIMVPKLAKDFYGPSPGIFIGTYGYPDVNAGPLGMISEQSSPSDLLKKNYQEIIAIRSGMIRSAKKENVKSKERIITNMQEISLAKMPTDVEMIFNKIPRLNINFDTIVQPMGAFAKLERLTLTQNPKISRKVERITGDDLKASQSAFMLYDAGIDVYKVQTILSSGVLGLAKRLVPTRWSITATDDIIAKNLLKQVKEYKSINEYMVFESFNLDNHFLILVMPGNWEFENVESWFSGAWNNSVEYEPFTGRTGYADKQAGGYYASRLAIVEHLHRIRRQARVFALREIHTEYTVPLGVWQVRENVRAAFGHGKRFAALGEALTYMGQLTKKPLSTYTKNSILLRQKRLSDYSV